MSLIVQNAKPSTLIDVLKQVRDALDAMGTFLPTAIGKAYLSMGPGSAPRVVFVPEGGRGQIGPPIEMGHAFSIAHSCTVHVRGRESGDDFDRFQETYLLGDMVIDLIQTAATGRIEWAEYGDGSPTDTDAFGAEVVFAFTYRRDVRHDAVRWGLPMATTDTSKMQPQPPPGTLAEGIDIDASTEPVPPNGGEWP